MNKTFHYLIAGSVAALLCAGGGGLWLVWQSIEQSHALERQNRELQASLEASRIRVENFCEYPVEALCRIDEKTGSVASAMADLVAPAPSALSETVDAPRALPSPVTPEPLPSVLPTAEKSGESSDVTAPAESQQSEKKSETSSALVSQPAQVAESVLAGSPISSATAGSDTATIEEVKNTTTVPADTAIVPAEASVEQKTEPVSEVNIAETTTKTPEPDAAKEQTSSPDTALPESTPIALAFTQEVSGKLMLLPTETPADSASAEKSVSHTSLSKAVENTPESHEKATDQAAPTTTQAPTAKATSKAVEAARKESRSSALPSVKKTWSRIEKDGEIFVFSISGEGSTLPAEGKLLSHPWRYELTLGGYWDVKKHDIPKNRLVQSLESRRAEGSTILTFRLSGKPYRCSLHRQDARTLSIRIR